MNIVKKVPNLLLLGLALISGLYFGIPSPDFPRQPHDSVQSLEDADAETPSRRTYFTNLSREEILAHYEKELQRGIFIPLPTYRVHHPPEDAYTLIRDQTRSVHLPEIIHPIRESLFVNFFEPKFAKDEIWYKGVHYQRRVTLKYVPTHVLPRVLINLAAVVFIWYVAKKFAKTTANFVKAIFAKND